MKRMVLLMLAAMLTLVFFATAGDEPSPTPDPGAKKEVYGDTPKELVPYGRFTEPYKTFFLEPNEYRGSVATSRSPSTWTASRSASSVRSRQPYR